MYVFLGGFHAQNRVCGDRSLSKKSIFVLAFGLNFWPVLGASSPLVTQISDYAYVRLVRLSNNKQ